MPKAPPLKKKQPTVKKSVKPTLKKQPTRSTVKQASVLKAKPAPRPHGFSRLNYRLWLISRSEYRARRRRLPTVWHITRLAALTLWRHKYLFLGIVLIYGLLNVVFVQGFANPGDITNWHTSLDNTLHGHLSSLGSGITAFTLLVGTSSSGSSSTSGAYQVMLALIVSLALIWSLRQVNAGTKIRIRDAYYKGVYPLVPFIIVLFIIGLQLLPGLVGGTLYALVMNNGIAVSLLEKTIWTLFFAGLLLVSFWLISSSIFALYIVTLPDMTPLKALRSARELVRYRRWTLLIKILYLPLLLLLLMAVVMAPIVILATSVTQWVFFILAMFAFAALHSYMYTLYRELIND